MIHRLRKPFEKISGPFVGLLLRHNFSATHLSLIAFFGTIIASIFIVFEQMKIGSWLFLIFSLFDALDGSLARKNNTEKPIGAFIDSVMDRFSDSAILLSIILYGFNIGSRTILLLGLLALIASLTTSYIKAKAEIFTEFGSIGLLQRPERILIIFLMLLFSHYLIAGLWVLVIGGYITVGQRFYTGCKKLNRQFLA